MGIVAASLARIVLALTVQFVSQLFFKPKRPQAQERDGPTEIKKANGPRYHGVGTFSAPTQLILAQTKRDTSWGGQNQNILHKLGVVASSPISRVVSYVIDARRVDVDVDGVVTTDPFGGSVRLAHRLGDGSGGNYQTLIDRFSEDDIWTTDHRCEGLATVLAEMIAPRDEDFADIFPKQQYTEITAICEAGAIFDPIEQDNVFSERPAANMAAFVQRHWAFGLDDVQINWDSIAAFDTLSDTPVITLTGDKPRYRIGGVYHEEEDPIDVLLRMADACDARPYIDVNGKFAVAGGYPGAVDVILTDADVFEIEETLEVEATERTTIAAGKYYSPEAGYQDYEFSEYVDDSALAAYGERRLNLDMSMCPDHAQAQWVAKIKLARANPDGMINLKGGLSMLKAAFPPLSGYHIFAFNSSALGINREYEVEGLSLSWQPGGTPNLSIRAQHFDRTAWDRDLEKEKPAPMRVEDLGSASPNYELVVVDSFAFDASRLEITLDLSTFDGNVEGQHQPMPVDFSLSNIPSSGWLDMNTQGATQELTSQPLDPGEHLIRLRYRYAGRGPWNYYKFDIALETLTEIVS